MSWSSTAPTATRRTSSRRSSEIKKQWDIDVVAGNVATREGCRDLIAAGADAVKVGIGPGSICTTRVISRRRRAADHGDLRSRPGGQGERKTPIIADGGIRYSGDITKAIAAGAHAVMIGGLFAGPRRKPGRDDPVPGPHVQGVSRHGFAGGDGERLERTISPGGSGNEKRKAGAGRVEGRVPFKGPLSPFLYQLVGGLRAGMGYCGTKTIEELRTEARFIQVSAGQCAGEPSA